MKKILALFLTGLLICGAFVIYAPMALAASGDVLFIYGTSAPSHAGDATFVQKLKALGFTVTEVEDANCTPEMADGKALIYIAESISSGNVADKYSNVTIPIINFEAGLFLELMINTETQDTDNFHVAVADGAAITIPDVSLTKGLAGDVPAYTSYDADMMWMLAIPSGSPTVLAHDKADPTKAAVFVYDAGAEMHGGFKAPGKRAMFYFKGYTSQIHDNMWKLWENVVKWSVGEYQEPAPATEAPPEAGAPAAETPTAPISPQTGDPAIIFLTLSALSAGGFCLFRKKSR